MAATGSLLLCVGFFLVTASRGYSLLWCVSFSLQCSSCYGAGSRCTGCSSRGTWAQSWHTGSVVAVHELGCSVACGVSPDQGSNQCPLYCKVDSEPLITREAPFRVFCLFVYHKWFFLDPLRWSCDFGLFSIDVLHWFFGC